MGEFLMLSVVGNYRLQISTAEENYSEFKRKSYCFISFTVHLTQSYSKYKYNISQNVAVE